MALLSGIRSASRRVGAFVKQHGKKLAIGGAIAGAVGLGALAISRMKGAKRRGKKSLHGQIKRVRQKTALLRAKRTYEKELMRV